MKKNILVIITFVLILLINQDLFSTVLKGKIYGVDDNNTKQSLKGATIVWLGTGIGTLSKENGNFEIDRMNDLNKLIVSYIGYKKDTIEIPVTQSFLEVELKSELELGEITVIGRQGTTISKAEIAKTEKITMQGLRKAACCNLGESFQTNAGVDVEYTDAVSGAKQIQLLGLDGSYTQIMTEKVPNLRGIGATYGLNYIPGPWMESIQISKGASSVLTGFESITGQINVEYKKPNTSEPVFVNLFANSFGRFEGDLNSKLEFTDKLSSMILIHGNTMQTKLDGNSDEFLDIPMNTQINVMNRWNYVTEQAHIQAAVKGLYEDRQGGQKAYYSENPSNFYGLNIHTERYEAFLKAGYVFETESYQSVAFIASVSDHKQYSFFGKNEYDGKQKSAYANLIYQFAFEAEQEADDAHEEESHEGHNHETKEDVHISSEGHDQFAEEEVNHEEKESEEQHEEIHKIKHNFNLGLSWQFDEYNELFKNIPLVRTENIPGAFAEYTLTGLWNLTLVGGFRTDFHNLYGTFLTPRFHVRYELNENTIFRASVGKGYHVANIYAENTGVMASSREFVIDTLNSIKPEEALNYGLNMTSDFYIGEMLFTLNADYYRTDFISQVIVDLDRDAGKALFYNLDGISYSNSFQIDLTFQPIDGLELITAYRFNDVKMTFGGKLEDKPMINKHKAFLNASYTTDDADWIFDFTINVNGGGRLPDTQHNPSSVKLEKEFPAFVMLHGQIEKEFELFSLYLGVENLLDFKQPNPILVYDNNPFGKYFDSSMIWGPIEGRVLYLGMRFNLK